ncbi:hypothetical protein Tco_0134245, partial [Tanacetum coccineum]
MDAPMIDLEEDLVVLFSDDNFGDNASNRVGEEEVWEIFVSADDTVPAD